MKAYITKYWETAGIIETEGEITETGSYFKSNDPKYSWNLFGKKDFHTLLDNAKMDVEIRRAKRIKSLEAKIQKLKNYQY